MTGEYPNLEAMAAGTISGAWREWPMMRPEAKALLAELAALREENARLRLQISDNAIKASGVLAKQAEELGALRWVVKRAHGALTDAGSVVVPGTLEGDLAPAIRQLTRERDDLAKDLAKLRAQITHDPATCHICQGAR